MRPYKYFTTLSDFVQFRNKIKLVQCPHCRRTGFLILHGKLPGTCCGVRGKPLERGHRFLCNNRRGRSGLPRILAILSRHQGCGRTFSILWSHTIKYYSASAQCMWKFLSSIKQGKEKNAVFKNSSFPFTSRCADRWLEKLRKYQFAIRSRLLKKTHPPRINTGNPLIQLLHHLKYAFTDSPCPITAYQEYFQAAFFKD